MDGLVMTAQLLFALTILVAVHEFGHFIAARMFKIRVDRFFIFFDPWFELFSKKIGDTIYGIGWLPLGGYVKIAGMLDESFDKEQLKEPPKPWEFRSKPSWQRIIVMVGGVTMNLILGMLIFCYLVLRYGETSLPVEELNKHGIVAQQLAQEIGLKTGDKVLALDGKPIEKFKDIISSDLVFGDDVTLTVLRDGEEIKIEIPGDFADRLADAGSDIREHFISERIPYRVGNVRSASNAEKGGLLNEDRIVNINGEDAVYFDQLRAILKKNIGKEVNLTVLREGELTNLKVLVDKDGTIGFESINELNYAKEKFDFLPSIALGVKKSWRSLFDSIKGIGKIISGKISFKKAMHGPIGIAKFYGPTWDWVKFWALTGVLSMWLAFINIVPIPALDGGHVMFLLYEMVTGRKPGDKFMEIMQIIGVVLLLGLMLFIIGNDILKLF